MHTDQLEECDGVWTAPLPVTKLVPDNYVFLYEGMDLPDNGEPLPLLFNVDDEKPVVWRFAGFAEQPSDTLVTLQFDAPDGFELSVDAPATAEIRVIAPGEDIGERWGAAR